MDLGRHLFYDKKLSGDNSMACGNCHLQENAFTDPNQFSVGIHQMSGRRNSMALFNIAYHRDGFFWDGRVANLRSQVLMPIEDPLELDADLDAVIIKLEADPMYVEKFTAAFGDEEITRERIGLALEQFGFSIISKDSKYDQYLQGLASLTASEERGRQLFFTEHRPNDPDNSGADCFHCHGGALFTNNLFMDNGLDTIFGTDTDKGLYEFTNSTFDIGKFKVPSLRNIEHSGPYMHDGRFTTLEEVVEHYNSGSVESPNLDPNMHAIVDHGLGLSEQDKTDLVAFLKTLSDDVLRTNPEYASPF
ncbi:MAG: c-type cytochrome [Saprospiraceae bacterium]|nr:c-type cytochrome [Saprospiraceae bacterium]